MVIGVVADAFVEARQRREALARDDRCVTFVSSLPKDDLQAAGKLQAVETRQSVRTCPPTPLLSLPFPQLSSLMCMFESARGLSMAFQPFHAYRTL